MVNILKPFSNFKSARKVRDTTVLVISAVKTTLFFSDHCYLTVKHWNMLSGNSGWYGSCETMVPDHQASSTTQRNRSPTFHWRLNAKSYIWRKTRKSTTSMGGKLEGESGWGKVEQQVLQLNCTKSYKNNKPSRLLTIHVVIFDGKVLAARISFLVDWLETEEDETRALGLLHRRRWAFLFVDFVFDGGDLDKFVFPC